MEKGRYQMKRMMLFAGALALLLGSNAVNAAVYNIYGKVGNGPPANKVVANMQFAVTGQTVTPPEVQTQITEADSTRMISEGTYDTITISEGDAIYVEGEVLARTIHNTAENAVLLFSSNKPSALTALESADIQSKNGLIQILGPGREYLTFGLSLKYESSATLRNVVIADHYEGLDVRNGGVSGERNGAQLAADQVFVLNNRNQLQNAGISGGNDYPPFDGHGARITLRNSVIWDSEPPVYGQYKEAIKLYLPLEFEAVNSSFSDNVNIGSQMTLAELESMSRQQSRIVFTDCAFSDWFAQELRKADFSDNLLDDDVFRFIAVQETRPILGGTHVVKTFPDVPAIAIADVTGNGAVTLEDFEVLADAYGKPNDEIPFARILDLDASGTSADDGDMLVFARAFAGLSASASDGELLASPQLSVLAEVLYRKHRPVADALMGNAVFGPAITSYLQRTVVTEVSGETPTAFRLEQSYPNPFNAETTIRFQLPEEADVILSVYNTAGQVVARLVDERLQAGSYIQQWDGLGADGRPVGTGTYIYRIRAGEYEQSGKMTLLR